MCYLVIGGVMCFRKVWMDVLVLIAVSSEIHPAS